MNATEIINKYTRGEATMEETNKALAEIKANTHLDPLKHMFTSGELLATHAETAETATGWGLLDTGTGSLDKVEVKDGHLVNCDCGDMYALCLIGGKMFEVKGTALVEK